MSGFWRFIKDIPLEKIYQFDSFSQAKAVATFDPDFFFVCNVCGQFHARSPRLETWHDNRYCCCKFAMEHGADFNENRLIWLPYMELILAIKKDSPELERIQMKLEYFDKTEDRFKGIMWIPHVEGEE